MPTHPELERFFFPDDDDRDLIALRRTDAHRLGMAVQICTVRYTTGELIGRPPFTKEFPYLPIGWLCWADRVPK